MKRAVIYCHLQNDLPRCFWTSLKKTRQLWDGDIYLIAPQREDAYRMLNEYNVKFIGEQTIGGELLKDYVHYTFFNTIHVGWNGFWDNACKRFIYLYEAQREYCINEMLHIETDVVPYININTMFEKFSSAYCDKLVFSPHAKYQTSCCTIFNSSVYNLKKFCEQIIEYFKRGPGYFYMQYPRETILNETHFAFTFIKENPRIVDLLPTTPEEKYAKEFGFIIDPTAWGMWIDGLHRDPGVPFATIYHNVGKLIVDLLYSVTWENGAPYIVDCKTNEKTPLATVHFNSKTPEKWI